MKYYLAHHGVQNQHWGVRHGPPYPLDSNSSKQAKRKSASKSSYDKLYGDKKGSTSHTGSLQKHDYAKSEKYVTAKKKYKEMYRKDKDFRKKVKADMEKAISERSTFNTPATIAATMGARALIASGAAVTPVILGTVGGLMVGDALRNAIKAEPGKRREAALTTVKDYLIPMHAFSGKHKAASSVENKYIEDIAKTL